MSGDVATTIEICADLARCCGAGHCVRIAPEVFDQSERDGTVILLQSRLPGRLEGVIREAASLCPTSAIIVRIHG